MNGCNSHADWVFASRLIQGKSSERDWGVLTSAHASRLIQRKSSERDWGVSTVDV